MRYKARFFLVLSLIVALSIPLEVLAVPIFSDGFESGDGSAWSGSAGSPAYGSSVVHTGTYSMTADASGEYVYRTITSADTVFVRVYFRFDTLPTGTGKECYILSMRDASTNQMDVGFGLTGSQESVLVYKRYASAGGVYTAFDYAINTWYCVEAEFVKSANGFYKVWIDGNLIYNSGTIDTSAAGSIVTVRVGMVTSDYTVTAYYDCAVVDSAYIGVESEDSYTLSLTVTAPQNTTYDETIPVSLSLTGNDTNPVYSWNVQFSNSSWLYGSNKTVTSYTMDVFENATDCLFACTLTGDNEYDYGEVYFSVEYVTEVADAWDEDLNNYFLAAVLLVMGFVFMGFMFLRRGN